MKVDNVKPLKCHGKSNFIKMQEVFFVEDVSDVKVGSANFHDIIKGVVLVRPSCKPPSPSQLLRRHLNEEVKHVKNEII